MKIKTSYRITLLGLVTLAVLANYSHPIEAKKKKPETIYEISGVARSGGTATRIEVRLFKWTTDEERETAKKVLSDGGNTGLYDHWDGLDAIGRFRLTNQPDAELKYAYRTESEGKVHIVLGTDRPIGFGEAGGSARSSRYILTLIKFEVDAETGKKGEGRIMAGARFVYDEEAGRMVPEAYAGQPILVGSVSVKEPTEEN
jgi:hypothetical protein